MDRYMLAQREYRTGCIVRIKHFIAKICCLVGGKLYGNYLISCYMMIKLVYFINAVAQIFLLDIFLNDNKYREENRGGRNVKAKQKCRRGSRSCGVVGGLCSSESWEAKKKNKNKKISSSR